MTKRCRVKVLELGIYVWAFLHEDTVCVLSLGVLVNRGGFFVAFPTFGNPENSQS